MKILITGAYGFVGTNLCGYLTERGHVCEALDVPAARREDVPYVAFHTWDGLEEIDFAQFDAVGLTQRVFDTMVRQARERGGAGRGRRVFVHFSSSKASADGNAYGRSKLAAERWLLSVPAASLGIGTVILRPAMIHGPGNKGNLNLLWGIAKRGLPWPLAAFENRRSFTAIGNVCAAVEALCARGQDGVYPIADDEMLSTNRLIELIAETCGRKAKLWRLPKGLMRLAAKAGDVLHLPLNTERLGKLTEDSFVDNAALKASLGWERMPVAAEDGMRATLRSFVG